MTSMKWPHGLAFATLVFVAGAPLACSSRSPEQASEARQNLERVADPTVAPTSGAPELDPPLPDLDGEHYTSFDLLQNRPLAHRVSVKDDARAYWIDAREPDFMRYIHGNHGREWIVGAEVDGGMLSATKGREARIWLPAPSGEIAELALRVFSPARGHNDLQITINGHRLEQVALEEGWQTLRLPLTGAPVRADNAIVLSFSNMGRVDGQLSGGGFAWARLGDALPEDVAVEDLAESQEVAEGPAKSGVAAEAGAESGAAVGAEGAGAAAVADSGAAETPEVAQKDVSAPSPEPHQHNLGQGEVALEAGQGLSWLVWAHQDAHVQLEVEAAPGCGPRVRLEREAGQGEVTQVLDDARALVKGRGDAQTTSWKLPMSEDAITRLEIFAGEGCKEAMTIKSAQVVREGTLPEMPETIEPPRYVLFWVIDTLRADYLPIHFETNVQAPNLKRLADEGVSFELAYVQGTESRASHASLFSGLYPNRHGVAGRGKVRDDVRVIQQFFKDADYRTAMYSSNGYASHLLNLRRAWDEYQNNIHEQTALDGMFMANQGLRWVESNLVHPFFLYLGTIDPHVTYRRHEEYIGLYDTEPYNGRFQRYISGEDLGLVKGKKLPVTDRDKERIINLYKNEVTYNDNAFGHLRAELERLGIWDDTLVVVTSDHGEEFWEHGSVGHGHNVHQEMVHVPLIFHYPKLPQGRVVKAGADVVDVLPTVTALLGLEHPEDKQGMNLLPYMYGQHGGYPSPAVATQYQLHYGMQAAQWKIYLRAGQFKLYDRSEDVQELNDVAEEHPLASRWMQDSVGWFRAHRARWDKERWGVPTNVAAGFWEKVSQVD
ncbi:sulfatase-like hydrolase/transferase [Lujinxingia vulgaris]|uniref:Sulfatase-like hydrolase/transferase n=1 Tax=Lujinxingia vulgaris TaxID=2600176 RepID=A0A5C6X913_9DELT|nr:sulfatase [Lujinxingia vulgaris]TXD37848.1 sulfatase-like hydrolase/transferase [Lujinxingia vulgaris]